MSAALAGQSVPLLLVAEDNAANQQVAVAMLAKLGFTAEVAADGAQAVAAYRSGRFAAIFMDCQMPVLDGYQAAAEIRALEAQGQHIPIIAMTASVTGDVKQRCAAVGMDAYLSKPVMLGDLRAILEQWVPGPISMMTTPSSTAVRSETLAAPFSADRIAELRTLNTSAGPDMFGELARQFIDDATRRLAVMRGALGSGDRQRAMAEAHAIYGGAATLGAGGLAEAAAELEADLAKGASLDPTRVSRITVEIQRARSYLNSEGLAERPG